MENENYPRSQHYYFAHLIMKNHFLFHAQELPTIRWSQSNDILYSNLWKSAQQFCSKEERKSKIDISQLKSFYEKLDENSTLIIIQLPEPNAITEAYFVCDYHNNKNPLDIITRYFTLEFHENNKICFCEWNKNGHILYKINDDGVNKKDWFVENVKEIVNNAKPE